MYTWSINIRNLLHNLFCNTAIGTWSGIGRGDQLGEAITTRKIISKSLSMCVFLVVEVFDAFLSHLCRMYCTNFKVVAETDDQIEVSFTKTWNVSLGRNLVPLNIDKRCIYSPINIYTYMVVTTILTVKLNISIHTYISSYICKIIM